MDVTIPLMIRNDDDILFVEEDNDTVSENEHSSQALPPCSRVENVYTELPPQKKSPVDLLDVPKSSTVSRSTSTESEIVIAMFDRSPSAARKKKHEYEEISVSSVTSKKSTDKAPELFRLLKRQTDASESNSSRRLENKGVEDDETLLEGLRLVVRKCTNPDPMKRPASFDIFDLLSGIGEKS